MSTERQSGAAGQGVDWLRRGEYEQSRVTGRARGLARSREDVLSSWLGPERSAGVFASFRPSYESIGGLVDSLLSRFSQGDVAILTRLQASWVDLFGHDIGSQCCPLSVTGSLLKIEVNNSAFLYVFEKQQKPYFLQRIQTFTGGAIREIRFVPRGSRRWLHSR